MVWHNRSEYGQYTRNFSRARAEYHRVPSGIFLGVILLLCRNGGVELHNRSGLMVALHGATLLAVVVYFRKEVREMIVGTIHGDRTHRSRASALLIATLPIVVVGPLVYQYVDTVFRSAGHRRVPSLSVQRLWCWWLMQYPRRVATKHLSAGAPLLRHGLLIGFFQVLAVLPGVSRSGITMAAGRLAGFSRPFAARFSFLLSIPTIAAALVFTGMKATNRCGGALRRRSGSFDCRACACICCRVCGHSLFFENYRPRRVRSVLRVSNISRCTGIAAAGVM